MSKKNKFKVTKEFLLLPLFLIIIAFFLGKNTQFGMQFSDLSIALFIIAFLSIPVIFNFMEKRK